MEIKKATIRIQAPTASYEHHQHSMKQLQYNALLKISIEHTKGKEMYMEGEELSHK